MKRFSLFLKYIPKDTVTKSIFFKHMHIHASSTQHAKRTKMKNTTTTKNHPTIRRKSSPKRVSCSQPWRCDEFSTMFDSSNEYFFFEIYNVWIHITDFYMWRELIKNSVEQLQLHRLIARTEKKGAKDHDAPLIFWSLFITSWLIIGNEWASIERRNQLIWKCDWFII